MKRWIYDFFNLLYPELCMGCESPLSTGENLICTTCHGHLPLTNFHKTSDEKMRELFYARINVEHVTSLFYYEKIGAVQHMMHELKYRGKEEISAYLGKWLATELSDHTGFQNIDVVIPVPVHPVRMKTRGYNQVSGFGKELAVVFGARFRESVLIKTKNTINQAKLNQSKRSDETQSPYELAETIPEGSHVLLVDDVVTTGTTLVLCARELLKIPGVKISIATMAISV
ncbi:MAG: ComF family protein [Nonlabens sp.]|uniref:ComF family protein n=1 Tax=Nonlabens sp. TaxID=1888209 RepID=UPI003EF5FEAE